MSLLCGEEEDNFFPELLLCKYKTGLRYNDEKKLANYGEQGRLSKHEAWYMWRLQDKCSAYVRNKKESTNGWDRESEGKLEGSKIREIVYKVSIIQIPVERVRIYILA